MPALHRVTLREAQTRVEVFLRERKWLPTNSAGRYYTLAHTVEEIGEIARCVTLLESRRSMVQGRDRSQVLAQLEQELGDGIWNLFKLASAYGIDVEDVFARSLTKNLRRFPVRARR